MFIQDHLQVAFPADPFQQPFQPCLRIQKMRGRDVDGIMIKDGFQLRLTVILFRETHVAVDQIILISSDTVVIVSVPILESESGQYINIGVFTALKILPEPVNLIIGFFALPVCRLRILPVIDHSSHHQGQDNGKDCADDSDQDPVPAFFPYDFGEVSNSAEAEYDHGRDKEEPDPGRHGEEVEGGGQQSYHAPANDPEQDMVFMLYKRKQDGNASQDQHRDLCPVERDVDAVDHFCFAEQLAPGMREQQESV